MKRLPWFQYWLDSHIAEIDGLPDEIVGLYTRCIHAFWNAGGTLPDDSEGLRNLLHKDPRSWDSRFWPALQPLFGRDGRVRNRLNENYAKAYATHRLHTLAGQAGGRPRKTAPADFAQTSGKVRANFSQSRASTSGKKNNATVGNIEKSESLALSEAKAGLPTYKIEDKPLLPSLTPPNSNGSAPAASSASALWGAPPPLPNHRPRRITATSSSLGSDSLRASRIVQNFHTTLGSSSTS